MITLKHYAIAAVLAGSLALPVAGAHAAGETHGNNAAATTGAAAETITPNVFKSLDTDKSGTLSEAEFNKLDNTTVDFSEIDVNGDGTLTLAEVQTTKTHD